jgi:hypothetical protein
MASKDQAFFFVALDFAPTALAACGLAELALAGAALVDFALAGVVPATLPTRSLAALLTLSATPLAAFSTFEVVVVPLAIARLVLRCDLIKRE